MGPSTIPVNGLNVISNNQKRTEEFDVDGAPLKEKSQRKQERNAL